MLVTARFAVRSIGDPNIRKVAMTGQLRCRSGGGRPSSLIVQLAGARFVGQSTRGVACTLKRPELNRSGGSWSGEIVGKCNGKPAIARVFAFDDTRGGGDVRLVVRSQVRACAVSLGKDSLLGKLSARMVHDVED
jgi:hypothetical protein